MTPANTDDGLVTIDLLEQQADVGLEPSEVVADHAYAGGELREQAQVRVRTLVTKASALPNDDYLHKNELEIDMEAGTVTCPAGEMAHFAGRSRPSIVSRRCSPPPPAHDARSRSDMSARSVVAGHINPFVHDDRAIDLWVVQ